MARIALGVSRWLDQFCRATVLVLGAACIVGVLSGGHAHAATSVVNNSGTPTPTLNGTYYTAGSPIYVTAGQTITVAMQVSYNGAGNWRSSSVHFGTSPPSTYTLGQNCANNTATPSSAGTFPHNFTVVVPTGLVGTVNVYFGTFTNTACGGSGGTLTWSNSAVGVTSAPSVTTNAASSISATGATLNGTVSANGGPATVTFEYGTTTSYGSTVTATQSPLAGSASGAAVSASITGLTCNTTYNFRAVGTNVVGTTNGGNLTFTTSACPVGGFDACETGCTVGATGWNQLYTKITGTAFTMDVIALNGSGGLASTFSGTASSVELIAYTAAQPASPACPAATPTATVSLGTSVAFSSGRYAASVPAFTAPYRDVRVRVVYNSTTYCVTDRFAVRPQGFSIGVLASGGGAFPTTMVAGTSFLLTATALIQSATTATGYDGSLASFNTAGSNVATHVGASDITTRLQNAGTNTVSFGSPASGVSSATVQYHDAGSFQVLAGAVADTSYTSVDSGGSDCIANSGSNTPSGGKYGCNITNQAASSLFGRFYPSFYTLVSSSVTGACGASPNDTTYMGQPALSVAYTLRAWSLANPTSLVLSKYDTASAGSSVSIATVSVVAANGTSATNLAGSLSGVTGTWSAGSYAVSTTGAAFARPAAPAGPYDSLYLGVGITDSDGAVLQSLDYNLGNPSCASGCSYRKLASTPTRMRFGRLRVFNVYGPDTLPLRVLMQSEYWTGFGFGKNTLDTCTVLKTDKSSLSFANWTRSLTSANMSVTGKVTLSGSNVNATGYLTVANPSPNVPGTVDLTVNLDTASPGEDKTWLQGAWVGTTYNQNPTARIGFGYFGAQPKSFIFSRENY